MKKVIILALALLPLFAFGQFSKGQVYLGGTMSASLQNSNEVLSLQNSAVKNSSFSVSPVFGYFLNPKLVLGGSIGYSSTLSEDDFLNNFYDTNNNPYPVEGHIKTTSNSIVVSSFTRYYIPLSNSFYFVPQGQISFSRTNNSYENLNNGSLGQETTNTPSYSLGATIKPVLVFFPSPKWGIEASVGSISFARTRYLPNVYSSNTFSFSAGSFSLGLSYYFKRKSE